MTIRSQLWGILRLRCPRCLQGKMFHGMFGMNDPCPVCGLVFQREEGYFLGAMYVSYLLSSVLLAVFFIAGFTLLSGWDLLLILVLIPLPYVPLVPAVFRYSRGIWIYVDRWVCPSDLSAGPYDKMRQAQDRSRGDDSSS